MGEDRAEGESELAFWAHSNPEAPEAGRVHGLREHLEETGRRAGEFAGAFGAHAWAQRAGLWHDLGKFSPAFQRYIRESSAGRDAHAHDSGGADAADPAPRARVDHSTAGAAWVVKRWLREQPSKPDKHQRLLATGMALGIAGHHAGLANVSDFNERVERKGAACLDEVVFALEQGWLARDVPAAMGWPALAERDDEQRRYEFWTRMVFSALCDGDFLDTESFFDATRTSAREPARPTLASLRAPLTATLDALAAEARLRSDPRVVSLREDVRAACVREAQSPPGFFTLTVPTGGGKTLASLAFALEHAAHTGQRRVVTAIPYTSITEQTADAYHRALGAHEGTVLEHHASFDDASVLRRHAAAGTSYADARSETAWTRLASENWDASVVVTTTVQLFESLFAHRTSRCRKLHRLAQSVIVLDEVQTVPLVLLVPIVDVLKTLVRDYGATVVLCTATQPVWDQSVLAARGIPGAREIYQPAPTPEPPLQRVRVTWPANPTEATPYATVAQWIADEPDVLAIVHKRDDARTLCGLVDALTGDQDTLHLSALMCGEHRRKVLAEIKARKRAGARVRAVATQLVEAGVDLDFAVVLRAMAGMDSLAQAAGRCNREGKLGHHGGHLRVYLAETKPPPGVLCDALAQTQLMLTMAASRGQVLDLFATATYREFFTRLYRSNEDQLDKNDVQAMRAAWRFRDVSDAVKLIDDWAVPVVVRWGDAERWLHALKRTLDAGERPPRYVLRKLQGFAVNVQRKDAERWLREGMLEAYGDLVVALREPFAGAYSERFGLVPADVGLVSIGRTVV
ncbi:MAG: CRISPR-associated endonuclease Cas3'' [Deltaproteobacteria bacterium]|nr:CRISPR-associated endonuclease Cas3'' [Deltaproteobacteria bacterium]